MIYFSDFGGTGGETYRYLRLTSDETFSLFIAWREIQVRATEGGADITGSGTASASSSGVGEPPAAAVDNSLTTQWISTSTTNQWWQYDFGSPVEIVEIALTPYMFNVGQNVAKNTLAQVSDDGVSWTDLFNMPFFWPFTNEVRVFPETLEAGYHRGWRLLCVDNNGNARTFIHNLQFRATAGGADQTFAVGSSGTGDGRAIRSSAFSSSTEAWEAFDDTRPDADGWLSDAATNEWIGFVSRVPIKVEEIVIESGDTFSVTRLPRNMQLQWSDDGGTTWTTQKTFAAQTGWTTFETRTLTAI